MPPQTSTVMRNSHIRKEKLGKQHDSLNKRVCQFTLSIPVLSEVKHLNSYALCSNRH